VSKVVAVVRFPLSRALASPLTCAFMCALLLIPGGHVCADDVGLEACLDVVIEKNGPPELAELCSFDEWEFECGKKASSDVAISAFVSPPKETKHNKTQEECRKLSNPHAPFEACGDQAGSYTEEEKNTHKRNAEFDCRARIRNVVGIHVIGCVPPEDPNPCQRGSCKPFYDDECPERQVEVMSAGRIQLNRDGTCQLICSATLVAPPLEVTASFGCSECKR